VPLLQPAVPGRLFFDLPSFYNDFATGKQILLFGGEGNK
jgi:hypothetical protein